MVEFSFTVNYRLRSDVQLIDLSLYARLMLKSLNKM